MRRMTLFMLPCLLLTTAASAAVIITTDDGNGADAHVRGFNLANTNYGNEITVTTKAAYRNDLNQFSRKSYLRFDLSSIAANVSDVSLTLMDTKDQGARLNLYVLNQDHSAEGWDEASIHWNNAPANDITDKILLLGSEVTFIGRLAADGSDATPTVINSSTTFLAGSHGDFVTAINDALADSGDSLVTFIITADLTPGGNGQDVELTFASSEHPTLAAPTLSLTLVPEPATLTLLGLGALAVIRRRN